MALPSAPVRAPIPLPAAPAATTYKTYSSYTPSPSDLAIHREFYSKINGWTNDVRPASTNLGGQSMIWSEPEVKSGHEMRAEVYKRRAGSPTPSNPHPVRSQQAATPARAAPSQPTFVKIRELQRDPSKSKPKPLLAADSVEHLNVSKYRPNPTPAPSRPASNGSARSSQRSIRDAYLAEALATPELEVMSPVERLERAATLSSEQRAARKSTQRVVSAPASKLASQPKLSTPAISRKTTARTAAPTGRDAQVAAELRGGQSDLQRSVTAPVSPAKVSTVAPASAVELIGKRQSPTASKQSKRPSQAQSVPQSAPPLGYQHAPARQEQHHASLHLRPPLLQHKSSTSLYPGSALGGAKTLGRKQRDGSTATLQAHFEPAIYPLPLSASSATTVLPHRPDVRHDNVSQPELIVPQPRKRPTATQREEQLEIERPRPPQTPFLPRRVPPQTDDHFSFDVPQGNNRRLHISLAWLKDGTATPKMSVVSSPDVGPPVPAKSPQWHAMRQHHDGPARQLPQLTEPFTTAEKPPQMYPQPLPQSQLQPQHIPQAPLLAAPQPQLHPLYPQPYPQPHDSRSRLPYLNADDRRPLSPPAPFPPAMRRVGPYPESVDSLPSEMPPFRDRLGMDLPRTEVPRPPAQAYGWGQLGGLWPGRFGDSTRHGATALQPDLGPDDSQSRAEQGYRPTASRFGPAPTPAPENPDGRSFGFAQVPPGLWERLRGFGRRPNLTVAPSRMDRNEGMLYGGKFMSSEGDMLQRDRVDWSRSRVGATRVELLEQRDSEDRARADRDAQRRQAAEWRRKERRARRAEEKARRAEKRRMQKEEQQRRMAARGPSRRFDFVRPRREAYDRDAAAMAPRSKGRMRSNDQQRIPKVLWRDRIKMRRQPASFYNPTSRRPAAPAPSHHYSTSEDTGASHVQRWQQDQRKHGGRARADRNDGGREAQRGWSLLRPVTKVLRAWFES